MNDPFSDAAPQARFARIALCGLAGSGRAWTALRIAQGLGGPITMIDTEQGRARQYGEEVAFRHAEVSDFHPEGLLDLLAHAAHQGTSTLIVHSWSSYWSGHGGILEQVEDAKIHRPKEPPWAKAGQYETTMHDALRGFPGHVIFTLKVKTDWVQDPEDPSRSMKVGLKPEQRDGWDYMMDLVADVETDASGRRLIVTASQVPGIDADTVHDGAGEDFGAEVRVALEKGTLLPSAMDYRNEAYDPGITADRLREMRGEVTRRHLSGAAVLDHRGNRGTLGELLDYLAGLRADIEKREARARQQERDREDAIASGAGY
ncbi:AAA family ATPase [Actinomadura yumaensis]|uniref:AAA family ATPase n=1 Tax=Actinomadura yumaensis TaxID=111807 RepID=A0ABW2CPI1_9ACTN